MEVGCRPAWFVARGISFAEYSLNPFCFMAVSAAVTNERQLFKYD